MRTKWVLDHSLFLLLGAAEPRLLTLTFHSPISVPTVTSTSFLPSYLADALCILKTPPERIISMSFISSVFFISSIYYLYFVTVPKRFLLFLNYSHPKRPGLILAHKVMKLSMYLTSPSIFLRPAS